MKQVILHLSDDMQILKSWSLSITDKMCDQVVNAIKNLKNRDEILNFIRKQLALKNAFIAKMQFQDSEAVIIDCRNNFKLV
jgi:hypothetical protein